MLVWVLVLVSPDVNRPHPLSLSQYELPELSLNGQRLEHAKLSNRTYWCRSGSQGLKAHILGHCNRGIPVAKPEALNPVPRCQFPDGTTCVAATSSQELGASSLPTNHGVAVGQPPKQDQDAGDFIIRSRLLGPGAATTSTIYKTVQARLEEIHPEKCTYR